MYRRIKFIRAISLIGTFVLAAATALAVDPPSDRGYPNQNTAEGEDALAARETFHPPMQLDG